MFFHKHSFILCPTDAVFCSKAGRCCGCSRDDKENDRSCNDLISFCIADCIAENIIADFITDFV